ncbi:MAG: hypothetical protein AAGD13_21475 [Pseudomonadota bacterium]
MTLTRVGSEILLGSAGSGVSGTAPSVAVLSNGQFVVTWVEGFLFGAPPGSGFTEDAFGGIFARIYNADGTASGSVFQVNVVAGQAQFSPQAIALDNGGFAIGWVDNTPGNGEIYVRTFDSTGVDTSGGEIRLTNDVSVPGGSDDNLGFIMTALSGGFAITYDDREDLLPDRLFHSAQILSNTGTVTTSEFELVNAGLFVVGQTQLTNGNVLTAHAGPARNVVLVFSDATLQGPPAGFAGATGPVSVLTASAPEDIERPLVSALSDGGFALAYFENETDNATAVKHFITVSAHDADGTLRNQVKIDAENLTFSEATTQFETLGLSGGGFVIAWVEDIHPTPDIATDRSLLMQAFNNDGTLNGAVVTINQNPSASPDQGPMKLSETANGEVIAVFVDGTDIPDTPNFFGDDIHASIFQTGPAPEAPGLTVTTVSDVVDEFDGETSLREAIGFVNDGTLSGTITFADGAGEAFENGGQIDLGGSQLILSAALTIDGDLDDDGVSDVTIDAQGASRVFEVNTGGAAIDGLTITGGSVGASGGGIIVLSGAGLTLTNSVVSGNTATGTSIGGGIFSEGTLTIESSTISGNSSERGAGVANYGGSATITDSTVSNNATAGFTSYGGGLYSRTGSLTVYNSTVSGNSTNFAGGGAFIRDSSANFTNTTFYGNNAVYQGGAFYGLGIHTTSFTNSTISGNYSQVVGGVSTGSKSATTTFNNVLFVGNTDSDGVSSDLFTFGSTHVFNGQNLIGANTTAYNAGALANVSNAAAADVFATTVLLNGADAGALADNGGAVETIALLANGSNPALDAGDDSLLAEATSGFDVNGDGDTLDTVTFDADGNARLNDVQGAANNGANTVDLGAVELNIGVLGSNSADVLTGTGAGETIAAGGGADLVLAGAGNDSVGGGTGGDALAGEAGNDTLSGEDGNDLLSGGPGDDLLYGGGDDDALAGGPGADGLFGGSGNDTADYGASGGPLSADLSDPSSNSGDAAGDQYDSVENLLGASGFSNTLTGDGVSNTITGGSQNDTISGEDGNDRLVGLGGQNTLDGGAGDDIFVVLNATDVIIEDPGEGYDRVLSSVSLTLGDNVEAGNLTGMQDLSMTAAESGSWIQGNAGNNTLNGQGANDRLDGNAGNDTLNGAGGNDILEGGSGDDVFVIGINAGTDRILDFVIGEDLIDLRPLGMGFDDLQISQVGGATHITHTGGLLILDGITATNLSASDLIDGTGLPVPIITGTPGDDNLSLPLGPLDIQGLGGNDVLRAFEGRVTLTGGEGDDLYFAFDPDTTIVELAGEGTDRVNTSVDLTLAPNIEIGVATGAGDIDITGNALINQLFGNADANVLNGMGANDRIDGRAGTDTIVGGTGNDFLIGGADADLFVFAPGAGIDRISDFEIGTDLIDLIATDLRFGDLAISQIGAATHIVYGTDRIVLDNTTATAIDQSSFLLANDRPVISGNVALPTIVEDDPGGAGQTLTALFGAQASDADGTIIGFAISAINADAATEGVWEVSLDGGSNFLPLDNPGIASPAAALVVPADLIVRFVPAQDFNGTPGSMTLFAIDDTYTGGFSGPGGIVSVDTTAGTPPGFLSTASGDISIEVTPVNDAPSITGPVSLTEADEGSTTHAGDSAAILFATAASDVDGTVVGFAITGNAATPAEGEWQISFDGGSSFVDLDTLNAAPNDAQALVIAPTAVLRFLAPLDFAPAGGTATPGALSVRALDDTYAGGFSDAVAPFIVDVSTHGQDTAISPFAAEVNAPIASIINPPVFISGSSTIQASVEDIDQVNNGDFDDLPPSDFSPPVDGATAVAGDVESWVFSDQVLGGIIRGGLQILPQVPDTETNAVMFANDGVTATNTFGVLQTAEPYIVDFDIYTRLASAGTSANVPTDWQLELLVDGQSVGLSATGTGPVSGGSASETVTFDPSSVDLSAFTVGTSTVALRFTNVSGDPAAQLNVDNVVVSGPDIEASGALSFSDADVGATHTASVTGVATSGDTDAILNIPDALALLTLGAIDQVNDTFDWTFDMDQDAIRDLGLGEAIDFMFTVELEDDTGQTASQDVTITVNSEPFETETVTSVQTLSGATGPIVQTIFAEPSAADGTADVRLVLDLAGITSVDRITFENANRVVDPVSGNQGTAFTVIDTFDFGDLTLRTDGLFELELGALGTIQQGSPPSGFVLVDPNVAGLAVRTLIDDPVTGDPFADVLFTRVDLDVI